MDHLSDFTLADRRESHRSGVLRRLFLGLSVARERRALAALDAHLLRDIGLTRDAAAREAARDPWDAPDTWRR